MKTILLTYDIKKTSDTIHAELKTRLIQHYGYSEKIKSDDGRNFMLPNTTLRKDNTTHEQSSIDFLRACNDVKATWERYIAAEYTVATFSNQ